MKKPSISEIMKAVSSMKNNMKDTQEALEKTAVTGSCGIDIEKPDVTITLNGKFSCLECHVSENFSELDQEIQSKMIQNAINDAVSQVAAATRSEIEKLSSQLQEGNNE